MEFLNQNPHLLDLGLAAIGAWLWVRYPTDILAIAAVIVGTINLFV